MLRPLLLVIALAMANAVITNNCTTFDPMICTSDANVYCFTDGTRVTGSCDANNKTCFEGGVVESVNCDAETTTEADNAGIFPNTNFQTIVALSLTAWLLKLIRTS